jgi:hypothetical protein
MKTKCEPGDILKFPDGSQWLFICYIEDVAILANRQKIASLQENPLRVTCKCCTPRLPELIITESPAPDPRDSQKTGPESP